MSLIKRQYKHLGAIQSDLETWEYSMVKAEVFRMYAKNERSSGRRNHPNKCKIRLEIKLLGYNSYGNQ